jgi:iron complex transport system substrate-binding protein
LGLGDRIVGVDRFSRYPPDALKKPRVGDYAAPNLEVIASLRPDLVMIPTNPVQLRQRLEALRLKVLELNQEGIPALYESIRIVGQATGTAAQAARLTERVAETSTRFGRARQTAEPVCCRRARHNAWKV